MLYSVAQPILFSQTVDIKFNKKLTHKIPYLHIGLCKELGCLVFQVERIEPFKQGEIKTKVNRCSVPY